MDIKGFLETVCKEIKYKPARAGIEEELKVHMQDIKEDYIKNGMQETEAEEKTVSQMGKAEEIGKKLNKIHKPKLDWKLLMLIAILIGFGIAISILKQQTTHNGYVGDTIIHILIGLILGIGVYFFDYKKLKKYSNIIYIIATIIMILPLIELHGIGSTINGRYYIFFLGCNFSPSMVAMPLYIISFIGYITNYNKENKIKIAIDTHEVSVKNGLFKMIFLCIFSLMLIINTSIINAMILSLIYLITTTIKIIQDDENKIKKLGILFSITGIIAFIIIASFSMSSYRLTRITASFNPEVDPQGSGYVGMLQKEVMENAKIIGEAETDIISNDEYIITKESNYTFIYLVGKTGILLSVILVFTIVLTSVKLIFNAKIIKDQYGKFLIIGLSTLYIIQSIASILMNINLGIISDVNIPFVTYGGVYLIINAISLAIMLSVYRRKDINIYDEKIEEQYH